MGKYFADQYSYLHFAVGIITYFWGIKLVPFFLVHSVFELSENTSIGMNIINKYMPFWPGSKPEADYPINMLGDTIFAILGWISAYLLDKLGSKYNWYDMHITS